MRADAPSGRSQEYDVRIPAALACLALTSACGAGQATVTAGGPPAGPSATRPAPTASPTPPAQGPHFATPQAAMRYLAAAWNRNDVVSLKHVTDPNARMELDDMHSEATNLRLDHCTFTKARGDYECFFTHDFPKGYVSKTGHGTAEFTVGPARRPGWYMTYFIECGG
jgi:hypothetical protein